VNANGGLAGGRKVQVDFIDSKLSADEARNALVRACQEDFAIVGTTSLFMNNIEPMTTCVDQAGKATGLPDVPVLQTEIAHQCSPISFAVIVVGLALVATAMFAGYTATQLGVGAAAHADRGTAMALYFSAYYGAGALGAYVPGLAWEAWGWRGVVAAGLCALATATVALALAGGGQR